MVSEVHSQMQMFCLQHHKFKKLSWFSNEGGLGMMLRLLICNMGGQGSSDRNNSLHM